MKENVIDAGHVIRARQDGKRKNAIARQGAPFFGGRIVEDDRDKVQAVRGPVRIVLVEGGPILLAAAVAAGAEVEQDGFAAQAGKRLRSSGAVVGQRKI